MKSYPSFNAFAKKYNPDTQVKFAADEHKTIMDEYSTLEVLDMAYGNNSAASWLTAALANINKFAGSKNMDDEQTESLAKIIAQKYKGVKFSVLMLFFYKFKCGDFGNFYGKVDPMVITCALKDFVKECEAKRQDYLNEEYAERKKVEDERLELQHRAESRWLRCQKNLIDNCPEDDGKEVFAGVSFFGFYEDKRTILLSVSDSDYQMIESRYFSYFKDAIVDAFPNIRVQCTLKNKDV